MNNIKILSANKSRLAKLKNNVLQIKELGLIIFFIIFGLIIYSLNRDFLTLSNIENVLRASILYFIPACGLTFVLIGGEIDLSVGSVLAFSGLMCTMVIKSGIPGPGWIVVIIGLIVGLISGVAIGYLNGILVTKLRIPSLVVTLGMLYIARGGIMMITRGESMFGLPILYKQITQGSLFGINNLIFYAIFFGVIFHIILNYTKFGYHVKGVGGNRNAARAAGINVEKIKIYIFIIAGFCAAVGGILYTSRVSLGSPYLAMGFELYVISAVIIGGTSLFGGSGSILGTFLGALFLSMINNGMQLMHINQFWRDFTVGLVMIAAVGIDQYRRNRMWQISG